MTLAFIVSDHCNAIRSTWYPQYAITKAHRSQYQGKGKLYNYVGQVRSPRVRGGCDVSRETLVTRGLRPPGHDMRVWCVMCSVQILLWILWTRGVRLGTQDSSRRWLRPSHSTSEVTKPGLGRARDLRPGRERRDQASGQWPPGPRHSQSTRGRARGRCVTITIMSWSQWPSDQWYDTLKNRKIHDVP